MSGKKASGAAKTKGGAASATRCVLLVLCGMPGSGKSTFAKELEKLGWVRINQDDLVTADECRKLLTSAMKHGKSVVLDRCNVHPKERKMWLTDAKKTNADVEAECMFFNFTADECKARAGGRKNHPTLAPENVGTVIDEFQRGLKDPEPWEGYKQIHVSTSDADTKAVLKAFADYSIDSKPLKRN